MAVFYCSNPMCMKAPNAARRAKALGYTNVHVMSAGIRGWLDATNLATGKQVWMYESGSPMSASPAVAAGVVVVGTNDGTIICFGA